MASIPGQVHLGEYFAGMQTSGRIPDEILKSGMDNLGKLSYILKDWTILTNVLHGYVGKSVTKKDRVYKVSQISEPSHQFTVTGASTGLHTSFQLATADTVGLRPGSVLFNTRKYVDTIVDNLVAGQINTRTSVAYDRLGWSTGNQINAVLFSNTYGSNVGLVPASGTPVTTYMTSFEQMLVLDITHLTGANVGTSTVTVRRCYMGVSALDKGGSLIPETIIAAEIAAQSTLATIGIGDVLIEGYPTDWEAGGAPDGYFKEIEIDSNVMQEMKWGVTVAKEIDLVQTWISEKPLDIYRWLVARQQLYQYEHSLWFNKKTTEQDAEGNKRYVFGGIEEFIPKDTAHNLRYTQNSLSMANINTLLSQVIRLGGSSKRFLFTGVTLTTALENMFYNSNQLVVNLEDSKKYMTEVKSLYAGGIEFKIIPSQILELSGYANKAFCLDLDGGSFVPCTMAGWDMQLTTDIGPKDKEVYKEKVVSMRGLERRNQQFQSVLDFSNIL